MIESIVEFVLNNPFAVFFAMVLLGLTFGGYLLLRRTVTEFSRGVRGE